MFTMLAVGGCVSEPAPGVDPEAVRHEPVVLRHAKDVAPNAATEDSVLVADSARLAEHYPVGFTRMAGEMRVKGDVPGDTWTFTLGGGGRTYNRTDIPDPDGVYRLLVTPAEYPGGELWTSYSPAADGPASASAGAKIDIEVTIFYD